jgi:hypothetical protein
MEDKRTMDEIINQARILEENNWNTMECVTGIDLLLTSNNNSTTKDKELSEKFSDIRKKAEEINHLTKNFLSTLESESKNIEY